MFLGEHQHSLDAKGRVILPARFRDQLEGGAVMAKALDGCLSVFPTDEFRQRAASLQEARVARLSASARPPGRSSPAPSRSRPTSRAGSRSRSHCGSTRASTAMSSSPATSTTSSCGTPRGSVRAIGSVPPRSSRARASTTSPKPRSTCPLKQRGPVRRARLQPLGRRGCLPLLRPLSAVADSGRHPGRRLSTGGLEPGPAVEMAPAPW